MGLQIWTNTPAQVLRQLLLSASGSVFSDPTSQPGQAWPLYYSSLPDGQAAPDNAACVYDTSGRTLARKLASGQTESSYGVQIKVRSSLYQTGFNILQTIQTQMDKVRWQSVTIGSTTYRVDTILKTSPVLSMGHDELRRSNNSLNLMMMFIND